MATYYIYPGWPTNGVGSEADPYNAWPAITSNNTYLQRAGTTANANVTAFGSSNLVFGKWGSGANPIISGGSGIALSASNASNVTISDMEFESTGNHAFSWNGGSGLTLTDCMATGQRTGANIISSAGAVANVTLTRFVARNTVAANENSGLFVAAQSGNAIRNLRINGSTFNGSIGFGAQIKAGDSNSSSSISGLTITNCSFSDNGSSGLIINTGMTALSEAKVVTNASITFCRALRNSGPGMSLCIRGGDSVVANNEVSGNNWAGLTGTGGLQLSGAYGVRVHGNVCQDNRTMFSYDGVGLYLDIATSALNNVGTEFCTVFGNYCEGNKDYAPDAANVGSSLISAGIGIYKSHNNTIMGNICVGNACGVCIGAWSINNKVYNNTPIDNKFGAAILWNQSSHANVVQNNVIKGSTSHALIAPDTGSRTSAGDITLSGTTGLVTVTSSVSAFATHSTGYAISAGSGYGHVVSKTSDTVVTIQVLSAFSGTSFANGNWAITFGEDQGTWSNYNDFSSNAENVSAGTGQTVVIGANSITSDPLLDASYRPRAGSPVIGAGIYIPGAKHMGGMPMNASSPDIGAYRYHPERRLALTRAA